MLIVHPQACMTKPSTRSGTAYDFSESAWCCGATSASRLRIPGSRVQRSIKALRATSKELPDIESAAISGRSSPSFMYEPMIISPSIVMVLP